VRVEIDADDSVTRGCFFRNSNDLKTSNGFVIVDTVAQLAYIVTQLEPLDRRSTPN